MNTLLLDLIDKLKKRKNIAPGIHPSVNNNIDWMIELIEKQLKGSSTIESESNDVNSIHESEIMIKAFAAVQEIFEGRTWLIEGRGAYPYNDDRYKEEVRYIMDEFNEVKTKAWKQIESKSFEYRDSIIKPYQDQITNLQSEKEELIELLNTKEPFSIIDVLTNLNKGTRLLLNKHDYDASDYEEMGLCLKISDQLLFKIKNHLSNKQNETVNSK